MKKLVNFSMSVKTRTGLSPKRDDAQPEMVLLSTSSGVLSRYTALVAVDQDGKALPEMEIHDTPSHESIRGNSPPIPVYRSRRKSGRTELFTSLYVGRRAKKCMGVSSSAENKFGFFQRSSAVEVVESKEKVFVCDGKPLQVDLMSQLIKCQKFDGSWEAKDISDTFCIDRNKMELKEYEVFGESTLATGLVIVVLQEGFSDRKGEWQLLANKAKGFLQQKLGEGKETDNADSLESFLKVVKQLYNELRLLYPNLSG